MINITGLTLEFHKFTLGEIDLQVEPGDYFMLVGPTGAGKTLLLECIAGLHKTKQGRILINGREVTGLEPEKRNLGMVHQDGVLFPHLSVTENIIFGLKTRRMPAAQIRRALHEAAGLVQVDHLLERKPGKLSGGEKQKVALARALVIKPDLLLLDEPLSALDPATRESLQGELIRIHRQLGITILHVTHDFDEAMMLGRHIAVMDNGKTQQTGTPEEIFYHPVSELVARFTMMRNILAGDIRQTEGGEAIFQSGSLSLATKAAKPGPATACIRPEDINISLDTSPPLPQNSFVFTISRMEDRGAAFHVYCGGSLEICSLVPRRQVLGMGLAVGKPVRVTLPGDAIHVI